MIVVDANLLIYATTKCPKQEVARRWLDEQISASGRVGLPWTSITAFLRIVTSVRLYKDAATSPATAWGQVESWLSAPNVWIPIPGEQHRSIFAETLRSTGSGGDLIGDAHLAALAIEHGLTLCSADGDFARFPRLKWINPLQI